MGGSIVDELVQTTLRELSQPEKPVQKSRVWQNTALLRGLTRAFTSTLPTWEKKQKA